MVMTRRAAKTRGHAAVAAEDELGHHRLLDVHVVVQRAQPRHARLSRPLAVRCQASGLRVTIQPNSSASTARSGVTTLRQVATTTGSAPASSRSQASWRERASAAIAARMSTPPRSSAPLPAARTKVLRGKVLGPWPLPG